MKVKICGITRTEDVKICQDNNADMMGFINMKRSSRYVDLDKINQLVGLMRDKNKAVLVLEVEDIKEALKIIKLSGISTLQLHSIKSEDIKILRQRYTSKTPLRIIKAIGIPEKIDTHKINEIKDYAEIYDFLLFDSQIKGKSGGTGKKIPIEQAVEAAEIAIGVNKKIKLFLAGGINLEYIKKEEDTIKNVLIMSM